MNKMPFTETYRPKNLDDISLILGDKELLFNIIAEGSMPNLFFYSYSAGTGKTSMAKIIIDLIGCDKLTLNASDERGIDTIREKVSNFCKTMSMTSGLKKCVFLDEADYLTSTAQASLRNLMEEVSSNAFFILTANYEEKIISPIRSRCIGINFNKPPKDQICNRLQGICKTEKIKIDYLDNLISHFYPDIRSMVSALQAIKLGKDYGEVFKQENFSRETLKEISQEKYDVIRQKIINESLDIKHFIKWIFGEVVNLNMPFSKAREICIILADMEKYISNGVSPKIIFLANIVRLSKCLRM